MKKYGRGYIYYGERKRLLTEDGNGVEEEEVVNESQSEEEEEILKPNSVLVVGGTGRTGQWVTLGLLNQGFNVRVLTREFEGAEKLFGTSGANVDVFEGNLNDISSVEEAVRGAVAIVCMAGDNYAWWQVLAGNRTDVDGTGTSTLVDAAKRAGTIARFVLVSDADESSTRGRRKRVAEDALRHSGLPYVIVRAATLKDEEGGLKEINVTPVPNAISNAGGAISRVDLAQVVCQAMVHHRTISELCETDPDGGFQFPDCILHVCNGEAEFVPDKRFWRNTFSTATDAFA